MKLLRFLFQAILDLLKGITYKWVVSLIGTLKGLLKAIRDLFARCKLAHFDKNATNDKCGTIHNPSFHRPDPLIYSQQYLLSLGLAVTWDNPDIILLKNGVVVSEGDLLPDTDYEIDATIWNNSYDAPVVGLTVDFSFLSFGAGTVSNPIGTRVINLGVKGGVNHPAHARIPWKTPPAGHYCIQVNLKWADDLNPANNMGQNNVNVVAAHSPATFDFQLRNNTGRQEKYTFRVDTYTLPVLSGCPEKIVNRRSNAEKWKEIQALHHAADYPVPAGWTVSTTPAEVILSPEDEITVEVMITPPDDFVGEKTFNVHAYAGNTRCAGGITAYVSKGV
jgi:hypothetical protein